MTTQENESKSYKELLNKINIFLNQNFTELTDQEIDNYLIDILQIDNINNPVVIVTLSPGEIYYRIRNEYDYKDDYLKTKKFNIKNVLGNPDAPLARMNLEHEQGLYLSNMYETAFLECNVKDKDVYTTSIFSPNEPINVIVTSVTGKYYDGVHQSNKIADLLSKFIFECLTMPSDKSKDTYRVTNSLLKILYKSFKTDGLLYYSSKKKNDFNLFINNQSVHKLDLKYIFSCTYDKKTTITSYDRVENNKKLVSDVTVQEVKEFFPHANINN